MRPLLGVVLVPSTPMNDERLTTSGSFRMTFAKRLLPLRHGWKRNGLRGFRDAQDHAGILHGEKALGNDDVTGKSSATNVPTVTTKRGRLMSQHESQDRAVTVDDPVRTNCSEAR